MSILQTTRDGTLTTQNREQFDAYISSVGELLQKNLQIPTYQRPYTWSIKNVRQLVSDILHFRASGHYRLGTLILHDFEDEEQGKQNVRAGAHVLNIVDGQQRYLTFGLMILALSTRSDELHDSLSTSLLERMENISIPRRHDGKSETNLRENYEYLLQVVKTWPINELNDFTEFFLKECSVVIMKVQDLDSAFQLFDSQNTRGKALFPTDLLKAHHLREFSQTSASREAILDTVRKWDALEPEEIEHLFAAVLFPIKRWTAHLPVPESGFKAEHIDLFKGIREGTAQYRWAHMALMAKSTVDQYRNSNATLRQYGVIEEFEFPFQILQPVIDGEMFFRMVHHYIHEARKIGITGSAHEEPAIQPAEELTSIIDRLNTMPSGTGNRYIRQLFDCFLMAYLDRFGWHETQQAAEKLAQRSYILRAKLQRVTMKSINNHARYTHERVNLPTENLFATIATAESPNVVLTERDPTVTVEEHQTLALPLQTLYSSAGQEPTR